MLSIGEFSRICQVSVKTLHYYDQIGLLKPINPTAETVRIHSRRNPGTFVLHRKKHTFFKTAAAKRETDTQTQGDRTDHYRTVRSLEGF